MQVSLDGVPLADTGRPVALFETGMPVRWYIPRTDVALEHLTESPTRTQCPYKGVAEYYSVTVGEHTIDDLAWTYTFPVVECRRIAQHVCFFSERVDITLDGEPQPRPHDQVGARDPRRATCSTSSDGAQAIDACPSHTAPTDDGLTPRDLVASRRSVRS